MPRYVVLVNTVSNVMTFAFMDPMRAIKKVRTLQRLGTPYSVSIDDKAVTDAQLEEHAARNSD
jgi:hypothetical protein